MRKDMSKSAIPSKTPRPRLVDVARASGTSTAVVSTVVNGRTNTSIRVGDDTRRRVLAAAKKLGYVANPVAQRLAMGHNRLLGIFTHEAVFPIDRRSFYHPFLVGIEQEAETQGYDLALFTSTSTGVGKRMIYRDGANRLQVASGSVLLGWAESTEEIQRLAADKYPFSYVGRREVPGVDVPYAAADYAQATSEIVQHLVEHNHRRIKYVSGLEDREAGSDRQRGYLEAAQKFGLPVEPTFPCHMTENEVRPSVIKQWVDEGFTAVVFEDDIVAVPVLEAASAAGLFVPGDLSLAVLGDPLVHTESTPNWTTFEIPRLEMGRHATRILIDTITRPVSCQANYVVLPCALRLGDTTGPPRGKEAS